MSETPTVKYRHTTCRSSTVSFPVGGMFKVDGEGYFAVPPETAYYIDVAQFPNIIKVNPDAAPDPRDAPPPVNPQAEEDAKLTDAASELVPELMKLTKAAAFSVAKQLGVETDPGMKKADLISKLSIEMARQGKVLDDFKVNDE